MIGSRTVFAKSAQDQWVPRHPVLRQRTEGSDQDGVVVPDFAAERIEENHQAGNERNEAGYGADYDGTRLFDEIAALRFGWNFWSFHAGAPHPGHARAAKL